METIGSPIEQMPEIRGGCPCIAGTGDTAHRIAWWYKKGLAPEEIVGRVGHLSLAQVHAALAYYHADQEAVEADLDAADANARRLAEQLKQQGT